jgi:hypothetical protein
MCGLLFTDVFKVECGNGVGHRLGRVGSSEPKGGSDGILIQMPTLSILSTDSLPY